MRHNLWLLSAFTVAATLTLNATDADAASKKSSKHHSAHLVPKSAKSKRASYDPIGAYAVNTQGCSGSGSSLAKAQVWKNANLAAQFIKQPDGSYQANLLPGSNNIDERLPIASIAKLMTALVIFDQVDQHHYDLDADMPVTKESLCLPDNRFAVIGLPSGITKINRGHALTQMIKISSNTMALSLAVDTAGSVEKFVDLMNAKAKAFGMNDTHFMNPNGLPEGDRKGEYTTARDMMLMAKNILPQMERFKQYSTAPLKTWTIPEKVNAGKSKLADMGAIFKTGTISHCSSLLTVAEQGENRVADIQLCGKSSTRFEKAIASVKSAFNRLGDMVVPSAMASDNQSNVPSNSPRTFDVSARQAHPLDP